MAYLTQADIEAQGFANTHFQYAGVKMTAQQWADYCTKLIAFIEQQINKHCKVESFEEHEVTEYRDGKGATGDDSGYLETDTVYVPRQQPVVSVTSVAEDVASKSQAASWTTRTARGDTGGDYEVWLDGGMTQINFHANAPTKKRRSVRLVYVAGYPSESPVLNEIKWIAIRMALNALFWKKKGQEAITVRMTGIRDFSPMFEIAPDYVVLTQEIKTDLDKYVAFPYDDDEI